MARYENGSVVNVGDMVGAGIVTEVGVEEMLDGTADFVTIRGSSDVGNIINSNIVGHNRIYGGNLGDELVGNDSSDHLYGLGGRDVLIGGGGSDKLYGGEGRDALIGGAGDDSLLGGAGVDILHGGEGGDILDGGAGNDDLYGGVGRDEFYFTGNFGTDLILDFEHGVDKIYIRAIADAVAGMSRAQATDHINNVILASEKYVRVGEANLASDPNQEIMVEAVLVGDGQGNEVYIAGSYPYHLSADDFVFQAA